MTVSGGGAMHGPAELGPLVACLLCGELDLAGRSGRRRGRNLCERCQRVRNRLDARRRRARRSGVAVEPERCWAEELTAAERVRALRDAAQRLGVTGQEPRVADPGVSLFEVASW